MLLTHRSESLWGRDVPELLLLWPRHSKQPLLNSWLRLCFTMHSSQRAADTQVIHGTWSVLGFLFFSFLVFKFRFISFCWSGGRNDKIYSIWAKMLLCVFLPASSDWFCSWQKAVGTGDGRKTWVQISALPLSGGVTLGRWFNLYVFLICKMRIMILTWKNCEAQMRD